MSGPVIVEIRAAEGGNDAKLLVGEQFSIYEKLAARTGLALTVLERTPARCIFRAEGKRAARAFRDEAGGHRWQRVPPTEKRGRVHTSTVTVAVLPEPTEAQVRLDLADVDVTTTRGSGPGGQHRNVTDSCVVARHLPTGITVRCDAERSQWQNREFALALLRARLWEAEQNRKQDERARRRRAQLGSGMRGDKRRTIRTQDGTVVDHLTGRRWRLRDYLRGAW